MRLNACKKEPSCLVTRFERNSLKETVLKNIMFVGKVFIELTLIYCSMGNEGSRSILPGLAGR